MSDAFPGSRVDAISWFAVLFELVGSLGLGTAGVYVLRQERRMQPGSAPGTQRVSAPR